MHTIEIVGTDITLEYPSNASEFDKEQFLALSRLMLLYNSNQITFEQFKVRLTYSFLNMARTVDTSLDENMPVVENVMRISRLADDFFNEETTEKGVVKVLKMGFYQQLLPTIKVGSRTFHGPNTALFNTVYGEYLQALSAFVDYSKSGEEEYLDKMIATLYRPAKSFPWARKWSDKYSSDPRRTFNAELTEHYVKTLKLLSPEIKNAIYLYFASCQHFIANNDELYIGGGASMDLSQLFKKTGTNDGKGLGMVGTLYVISETHVFGNTEKTARQNTYDVLAYLVHQAERKKEELKQLKSQRNATVRRSGRIRR